MGLTQAAIEALGFRPMDPGTTIKAQFYTLFIYEVRGFTLPDNLTMIENCKCNGISYRVGIGNSVSAIYDQVTGLEYIDDEKTWETESSCSAPYIIIQIGPTKSYKHSEGNIKVDNNQIMTYDLFEGAKSELKLLQDDIMASIETALTCAARASDRRTRFKLVDRFTYGITPSQVTVTDVKIEMRGSGYAATPVDHEWTGVFLTSMERIADTVNPKVSRFFQLGMKDDDILKRFLYLFLAIEIETHRVFKTIDHTDRCQKMISLPERVRAPGVALLTEHPASLRRLVERFLWCAICEWEHIGEAEISEFKRLKRIRDEIAHGVIASPPAYAVPAAEDLAAKLLL